MSQAAKTFHAHPFRKNGTTHAVITTAKKVSRRSHGRKQRTHTLCGKPLTKDFQRLGPSMHRMGMTPVTCDTGVHSMTGLMEVLEGIENGNY